MKIAIMQPYIFPYIGYFQLISSVDKFIIYDDVNFIKQGWINRNNILLNGGRHTFSVPIKNQSSFTPINETEINEKLYPKWKEGFLKTLELNYKKAPHFNDTFELVSNVLNAVASTISSLAGLSITKVCTYLQLPVKIETTSTVYGNSVLKGVERVLDICRIEKADTYINATGGQELYSKDEFKVHGINLLFIESVNKEYRQFNNEFVPYLSIIDIMMFNSAAEIKNILQQYNLK